MQSEPTDQDSTPISPVATLVWAATTASFLVSLANVWWLAEQIGIGRIRDLTPYWILGRLFHYLDLPFFLAGLDVANAHFDLSLTYPLLQFVFVAIVANLGLALVTVLVPLLLVMYVSRNFRLNDAHEAIHWFWGSSFPLGMFVLFLHPAILRPIHVAFEGKQKSLALGVAIVVLFVLWLLLAVLLRGRGQAGRFLRWAGWSAAGLGFAAMLVAGGARGLQAKARADAAPAVDQSLPNILLVSIDSLRRDHLGCYGYTRDTSPSIDGLAKEGTRFEVVAAPSSWTLPSHHTLLTALPPTEHGVINDGMRLSPKVLSLPEVLWRAGYSTAGFISGPYLDASFGFSQGFDRYDDHTVSGAAGVESHRVVTSPGLYDLVDGYLSGWDDDGRKRPFFVFLHMWDVHYDYIAPPPYDRMFDPDYDGAIDGHNFIGDHVHPEMDRRDLEHLVALYDGEIRYTDFYLGKIFDRLRELKILDDTIVVVTADHGEEFFEHGKKGHRGNLYDETVLVPLVVRFPAKVPPGSTVEQQVRLMDIAPTILSLADLPIPESFGSVHATGTLAATNLSPLFTPGTSEDPEPLPASGDLEGRMAYLRTDTSKLIHHFERSRIDEFYALDRDPGEQMDLFTEDPARGIKARKELLAWRALHEASLDRAKQMVLTEDQEELLRSLGYIQ